MPWFPASLMALFLDCLNGIPPLFLIIGIVTLLNEVHFGKRAVAAVGEIIDLHYTRSGKGGGTYHPVVRFQCMDEERWEEEMVFESSYGS